MKKILKDLYPYLLIVILVITFRYFIATPVRVNGDSMNSTLKNGEILILNKLDKSYKRFDIVVIDIGEERIIKRIIALPGETIKYKSNQLYINNKKIEDVSIVRTNNFTLKELYNIEIIPDNYYFVMGDNRTNSLDSRDYRIGLVKKEDILGTTNIRLFPLNKIGTLK